MSFLKAAADLNFILGWERTTVKSQSRDITMEIERFLTYYHFNLNKRKSSYIKDSLIRRSSMYANFLFRYECSDGSGMSITSRTTLSNQKRKNIPPVYAECIGLVLK